MKRYSIHFLNISLSIGFLVLAAMAETRTDMLEHAPAVILLLGAAGLFLAVEISYLLDNPIQ